MVVEAAEKYNRHTHVLSVYPFTQVIRFESISRLYVCEINGPSIDLSHSHGEVSGNAQSLKIDI